MSLLILLELYTSSTPVSSFFFFFLSHRAHRDLHSFPTRRSSDPALQTYDSWQRLVIVHELTHVFHLDRSRGIWRARSEEHTSELQSLRHLVCRLLLEKKKKNTNEFQLKENIS